jgi:WD40 repeat protein
MSRSPPAVIDWTMRRLGILRLWLLIRASSDGRITEVETFFCYSPQRIASGGCDNCVRIWRFNGQEQRWHKDAELRREGQTAHDDWVRDVAWAPSVGLPGSLIATCGQVCPWPAHCLSACILARLFLCASCNLPYWLDWSLALTPGKAVARPGVA